jgi:starvation-inducible DNA-binding protein
MPVSPGLELNHGDRALIAEGLTQILGETMLLAFKTRSLAWMLEGPGLLIAASELLEQADQLLRALDPIARRIRVLGFRVPICASELAGAARQVSDQQGAFGSAEIGLRQLGRDHCEIAGSLRFLRPVVQDIGDGASALLLDQRLTFHEESADRLESLTIRIGDEGRRYEEMLRSAPEAD